MVWVSSLTDRASSTLMFPVCGPRRCLSRCCVRTLESLKTAFGWEEIAGISWPPCEGERVKIVGYSRVGRPRGISWVVRYVWARFMAGSDNHVLDGDGGSKQRRLTAVPTPRPGPTSTNRPPRLLAEGLLMHAFRPAKGFTAIEYGRRVLKGAKLGEHDRQYTDIFAPMNLRCSSSRHMSRA